jgi:hypothetical protein
MHLCSVACRLFSCSWNSELRVCTEPKPLLAMSISANHRQCQTRCPHGYSVWWNIVYVLLGLVHTRHRQTDEHPRQTACQAYTDKLCITHRKGTAPLSTPCIYRCASAAIVQDNSER